MHSNLINKARNVTVEIHLTSGTKVAGRILDVDGVFIELEVKVGGNGLFVADKAIFDKGADNLRADRILVGINDISIIA
jgi:hypothetical protein